MLGRKPDRFATLTAMALAMGFSTEELLAGTSGRLKSRGPVSVDPKTIPQGKNRPCSCGSKKKYKMCCLSLKAKCPNCGDGIHGKDSLCGVCYNEYLGTHHGGR